MMIEPRRTVRNLDTYRPPLEGRRDRIRLDFNENTAPVPGLLPGLPATMVSAYPEYGALIARLAAHWNIPSDHLLVTNGSDEGLCVVTGTFIEPNEAAAVVAAPRSR